MDSTGVQKSDSHDVPGLTKDGASAPEAEPPVIARVEEDRLLLDLRTVFPEQEPALLAALAAALR